MKNKCRVVLSFDDGRKDFYENVFPLLKKYFVKATLNVVTGYTDETIKSDYQTCNFNELKEMSDSKLVEIGLHGDAHLRHQTIEDLDSSLYKISKNFGELDAYSLALPFNQSPSLNIKKWCTEKSIKVLRSGMVPTKRSIFLIVSKIFGKKINFEKKSKLIIKKNRNGTHSKKLKIFYSIPIENERNVDEYLNIFKYTKQSDVVIFMFHSIYTENDNNVHFKKGAWDVLKFERLISCLKNNLDVEIVFQKEL